MSTRRFKKTFVFTNVGTEFTTSNAITPYGLTSGQIGFFIANNDETIGVGTGATPAPATIPRIQIHQNLGDNRFGTIRTKTIEVGKVRRYYKTNPSNAVAQVLHLGYNEASTATDLTLPVIDAGKTSAEVYVYLQFFSKKMRLVYGDLGFRQTLIINVTAADTRDTFAQKIIDAITLSGVRAGDMAISKELAGLVTAVKVTTGTSGMADYRVGVKITTIAIAEDDLFNLVQPIVYNDRELVTFTASLHYKNTVTTIPITETTAANAGTGWAAQVAVEEAESQGYDRHREFFDNAMYEKQNPFSLRATKGVKYDALYVEFDWTHDTPGGYPSHITEPYTVQIFGPTTTLQPVAAVLNSWLTGRFAAITL